MASLTTALSVVSIFYGVHTGFGYSTSPPPPTPQSTARSYYPSTTPYWRTTTRSYYPQTTPYWRTTTRSYYPSTTPYWWQRSTTRSYYPTTTPYWWQRSTTTRSYYPQTTPYWWQRATTRSYYPQTTPYWWQTTTPSWRRSTTTAQKEETLLSCEGDVFTIKLTRDWLNRNYGPFFERNILFGSCTMWNRSYGTAPSITRRYHFTSCGTTRTQTENYIIYSNKIRPDRAGVITRVDDSYLIQCKISREAVGGNNFITENATKVYYGEGNYSMYLRFSRQQQSGYIYSYPVTLDINEELYGQVRVNRYDRGLNPVIEDCYAKPNQTSSTLVYYLIKNRCVVDSTTKYYGNGTFSFKTFDFIQQHGAVNIICRVYVCTDGDTSYRCTRQCVRRRSVRQKRSAIDVEPISVFEGPFVVAVEDSDSIVAIATGSAVGGVVVIGFVVAIIVKVKPLLAAAKIAPAGYSSVPQSLPAVVA